ncbi:MAG: LacI family transcriptional regulator [Bacteroidales bacterium]|nr:LacI family transcriptional regulator [Bacteroidales bacterium]
MPEKQLTIIDIARRLNLSKSTVSRAFRDTYDVNPETRRKVLELARELDFEPSSIAMGLRQHKTYTIGVVIPSFRIPFYSVAISGIQDVFSSAGYNVMTCQSNESCEMEISNINSLMRSRVDGIMISLSRQTSIFGHLEKLRKKGVPLVMFNRICSGLNIPSVSVNDYRSAYMATEYLISRGCRRIVHISGPSGLKLTDDRKSGFIDCLKENNQGYNENLVIESDFSIESGGNAALQIVQMKELPDAIFCVCDAVAFGVIGVLKRNGIRIPADISIMGFTDEPAAAFIDPPLTTVSQPINEIGKTAADLLLKQINRKLNVKENTKINLDTSLIIRKSTL